MKSAKLLGIISLSLLLSLFLLYSCEDNKEGEELFELPKESQTGNNTLGCYINGDLFVNSKKSIYWQSNPVGAIYYKDLKLLSLGADAKNGGSMSLVVLNPTENEKKRINEVIYYPTKKEEATYIFGGKEVGEITITKFDTINKIVSGQFNFSGRSRFSNESFKALGDSVVHVTSGRFDIQFEIR